MNWKKVTPVAAAVVLGLVAARLGMKIVENSGPRVEAVSNLVPVVVATRDIDAGASLSDADLSLVKVPAEAIAAGTFTSTMQASGKVLKIGLVRGQTLTPNLLAEDGAGYGMGATLTPGMRAVTVDVTESSSVAGFIMPHCWVDVVATLSDGNQNKSIARTIVENVSVIAVGSRTNPNVAADPTAPPMKTATLLVTPKQAEKVELAATLSRVRLVLRNGKDATPNETEGVTLAELKGRETDPFADPSGLKNASTTQPSDSAPAVQTVSNPLPLVPAKRTWTVQVIKGGVVTTQTFDLPEQPAPAAEPMQPAAVTADLPTEEVNVPDDTMVHIDLNQN